MKGLRVLNRPGFRGLFRFLRFVESLRDSNQDMAVANVVTEADDVVRLMTIHKSKGLEFPVVFLPITSASKRMLERNLIYTAITRAKSKLILLGELQAFDYATKHIGTARKTYLIERFQRLN